MTRDFGFSLDKVNWLGNVINVTYLPTSVIVPIICTRYGIRMTVRCSVALGCSVEGNRLMGLSLSVAQCYLGAAFLILSAWVRYAGTAHSLSENGAYALIITGQVRVDSSPLSSSRPRIAHVQLCIFSDPLWRRTARIPGHRPALLRDMV